LCRVDAQIQQLTEKVERISSNANDEASRRTNQSDESHRATRLDSLFDKQQDANRLLTDIQQRLDRAPTLPDGVAKQLGSTQHVRRRVRPVHGQLFRCSRRHQTVAGAVEAQQRTVERVDAHAEGHRRTGEARRSDGRRSVGTDLVAIDTLDVERRTNEPSASSVESRASRRVAAARPANVGRRQGQSIHQSVDASNNYSKFASRCVRRHSNVSQTSRTVAIGPCGPRPSARRSSCLSVRLSVCRNVPTRCSSWSSAS
jgi:hypothetical protein